MSTNIGMLLHQLPYNLKTIFRKYENKCKNKINKIWSLKFNQTCFNENLWPTYSTIRHHDPALNRNYHTKKYRQYLIEREIEKCTTDIQKITTEITQLKEIINNYDINPELKTPVEEEYKTLLLNHEHVTKTRIIKKLNNLYNGVIKIKDTSDSYINLSNYEHTDKQK